MNQTSSEVRITRKKYQHPFLLLKLAFSVNFLFVIDQSIEHLSRHLFYKTICSRSSNPYNFQHFSFFIFCFHLTPKNLPSKSPTSRASSKIKNVITRTFIFLVFGFCSLFTDLQKKVLVSYKKWAPVVQFRLLCCCWVWFFLTTCFYLNKLGWMINTQAKRRSGTSLLLKMCTIDIRFVCLYSRRKYVLSKLLWVFNTLAQVQNVWNAILILF